MGRVEDEGRSVDYRKNGDGWMKTQSPIYHAFKYAATAWGGHGVL